MKNIFVFIALVIGALNVYAQNSPRDLITKNWKTIGLCEDKDAAYFLYIDTITNDYIADLYKCRNELEHLSVPKTVKHGKDKFTVRSISIRFSNRLRSINIPSTVWVISGLCAAPQLNTIVFDKKSELKVIDNFCFFNYNQLTHIELPASVEAIGNGAFEECKSLTSVVLPRNIKSIGKSAFRKCENLKYIQWTENEKGSIIDDTYDKRLQYIEEGVFAECVSLVDVYFPFSLNKIGRVAFSQCKNLRSVVVAEWTFNGPEIGDYAFLGCTALLELRSEYQERNVIHLRGEVGNAAFSDCKSIKKIGSSIVDSIKQDAFWCCESLEEASFTTKYIGTNSFWGCRSLKKLFLIGTEEIGFQAFASCPNLENVYLGDSIKRIDTWAFMDCSSLKSIYGINASVELGDNVFSSCEKLDMNPIQMSYEHNVRKELKKRIETWQQKKEYESTSQWRERVTMETRNKKVKEYKDSVKQQYIHKYAPRELECTIDSYDADGEVFKIEVGNLNTYYHLGMQKRCGDLVFTYVKVPRNEAASFKASWDKVKIEPTYCISKDYLGIASCKFKLNGKTYNSPVLYDDETANVELNLSPLDIWDDNKNNLAQEKYDDTLDKNIPKTNAINDKTFVVIIGNEFYKEVSKVSYAQNDAKIFAEYCQKTLGVSSKNIRNYQNATYAMMLSAIKDMKSISEAYNGDVNFIFYYCGHGVPNEKTHDAYLLPIDADPSDIETCYPISRLYTELGKMSANRITVFMDACFSGAQRGEGMLVEARGVAIKAKTSVPQGNMVVFSAASGDETAYPYKEKGHGMFTYFLLKKLNETKGNVTLSELGDYITTQVKQQSIVVNRKSQTPTVVPSSAMGGEWREWKLK